MIMNQNIKNIFGGLLLLAFAGLIYADATGQLGGLHLWSLFFTFCFGVEVFNALSKRDVAETCFSLGILVIIWRKQLGIGNLSIWTLLGITILVSIGLAMLLRPLTHKSKAQFSFAFSKTGDDDTAVDTDEDIAINTHMSSTTRYVRSTDFKCANIQVNLGTAKVFFDQAAITNSPAYINIDGNIGEVDLYIPRDWQIENQLNTFIGDINIKNKDQSTPNGPTVILSGNLHIGDVDVHYL
jgi:predicted membrane protein